MAGVYRLEVKSTCNSVVSGSSELTVNKCASNIHDQVGVTTYAAYPNPFRSKLHISYEAKENQMAQAFIYDVEGRIVYHSQLPTTVGKNQQIIFPSNLLNGAYMLFLEADRQKQPFKLLREE